MVSQNDTPHPRKNTSAPAQRARILKYLQEHGPLTSLHARGPLNCYHPNARIKELRAMGYGIETHWRTVIDEYGNEHRVGLWVLVSLPEAANDERESAGGAA